MNNTTICKKVFTCIIITLVKIRIIEMSKLTKKMFIVIYSLIGCGNSEHGILETSSTTWM